MAAPRPRILNLRLIVLAIALGAVLAVASVPVAAVVVAHTLAPSPLDTRAERFEADGHMVYLIRYDYPFGMATYWESGSEPLNDRPLLLAKLNSYGIKDVTRDRRPRDARTELDGQMRIAASYRVGWPFHPVRGLRRLTSTSARDTWMWEPEVDGREYTVPYLPHWPGLLANTLFYALLVLVPVALRRWWRVRRRRSRNLCAACGYDLSGSAGVCPECGLASARASVERG